MRTPIYSLYPYTALFRSRRRRLPQLDVAQADILKRPQLVRQRREILENWQCLIDGEVEDVGDRLPAIFDLERFAVVTPDRKSTRLNSSHGYITYAVFCLK